MLQGNRHFGFAHKQMKVSGLLPCAVFLAESGGGPEPCQFCRLLGDQLVQGLETEMCIFSFWARKNSESVGVGRHSGDHLAFGDGEIEAHK